MPSVMNNGTTDDRMPNTTNPVTRLTPRAAR